MVISYGLRTLIEKVAAPREGDSGVEKGRQEVGKWSGSGRDCVSPMGVKRQTRCRQDLIESGLESKTDREQKMRIPEE